MPSTLHARERGIPVSAEAPRSSAGMESRLSDSAQSELCGSSGIKLDYIPPRVAPADSSAARKFAGGRQLDWNSPDRTIVDSVVWSRETRVREYAIERDALLFHPELQLLCQLNETACFIWRNCEGRRIDELARQLQSAYTVESATARQHVLRIMELFSLSGFVAEESLHAVG